MDLPTRAQDRESRAELFQAVAQKQEIQNPARIFLEKMNELAETGAMLFQAAELIRLEREERRFQSRKKRGTEDQN